jgi:hypothetical protein
MQASSDAGGSSAERRQQLVAQLTHKEGAARAALEALKQVCRSTANCTHDRKGSKAEQHPAALPCAVFLPMVAMAASARNMAGALSYIRTAVWIRKPADAASALVVCSHFVSCCLQGCSLSKAREVGATVMKQAQELAADSQGQLPLSAAGGSTAQAQCVLLGGGQPCAASEQQQGGGPVAADSGSAAAGRQTRVAFSAKQQPSWQQHGSASPPPRSPAGEWAAVFDDAAVTAAGNSQQQRRWAVPVIAQSTQLVCSSSL